MEEDYQGQLSQNEKEMEEMKKTFEQKLEEMRVTGNIVCVSS